MKRKIAIIADGWRRHITYVWIRGCRNYIKEHELDIEISVFHSFGNFSRDEKFNAGEYNIIHLPDLSQFDGIILEVTNMLNQKKKQQIIRIIQVEFRVGRHGQDLPVIGIHHKDSYVFSAFAV